MKIYQIHEYCIGYDDYRDNIIVSYLNKDKAELELEKLKDKNKTDIKCNSCPVCHCPDNCNRKCGDKKDCIDYCKKLAKEYCDKFEEDNEYNFGCENYKDIEEIMYKIKEVEVIE